MSGYCLLFAGQSVQRPGMCRDLWDLPAATEALERLGPAMGDDLVEITTEMAAHELSRSWNSQRAIHAHHIGHLLALEASHPHLEVTSVIGHSVGVVAALVAARALSIEDSGRFISERARAFSDICEQSELPHGLAAVTCDDPELVERALADFPTLSLCLQNSWERWVVGGPTAVLDAFAISADEEGWAMRTTPLAVEGAFHSAQFEACRDRLAGVLETIEIRPPAAAVYMGTSGQREEDPERIRQLLCEQPARAELHLDAVLAAGEEGARTFLEVATRPEPVTWLSEQLVDEHDEPLPDLRALAVTTSELGSADL